MIKKVCVVKFVACSRFLAPTVAPTGSQLSKKRSRRGGATMSAHVTPLPGSRNSRNGSSRLTRRSRSCGPTLVSQKVTVPKHFLTSRSEKHTCLTFGLKPTIDAHKRVMCEGCLFVTGQNKDIVTTEIIEQERTSAKKKCRRPWDPKWIYHDESGKVRRHYDFLALIDTEDEIVIEDATTPNSQTNSPVKKKLRREKNKAPSNNDEESNLQTPPVLSRAISIFDINDNLTNEAVALFEEKLKAARKNGVPPNDNDNRVAGMLMKWMFNNMRMRPTLGCKWQR